MSKALRTIINKTRNRDSQSLVTSQRLLPALLGASPFPPHMDVKLPYEYTFTLSSTAGFARIFGTEQVFRLNSLFDPDLTNVGHQPFGYDQLTPIYGKYAVTACEVELEFFGSNTDDLFVGFTIQSGQNTTALGGSDIDAAGERQSVLVRALPINGVGNRWVHKELFPIHLIEGLPSGVVLRDDNYQAVVTTNPNAQSYLRIAAATVVNTSKACQCKAKLVYHARMFDRVSMAQS